MGAKMSNIAIGRGSEIVARFWPRIKWVSRSVALTFGNKIDAEDIRQEAAILVLSYAGVTEGLHHGKLAAWERVAGGDEARVNALLARTLRLDLNRMIGRRLDRRIFTTSLSCVPLGGELRDDGFEDRLIDTMSHGTGTLRDKYPMLVRHFIDGYPLRAIAADEGVCVQAIWKRISKEKTALGRVHGFKSRHLHHAA
jgi:hypothetical protein